MDPNHRKIYPEARPAAYALAAMLLVCLWQWATVTANFGGNWSALFCTGSLRGVPPSLAGERIYQFPGSTGFDGQIYHYIAHDPLMRSAELTSYVDAPRYRYRRILVPAMAWLLALGRSGGIDTAYIAVCLLWIGVGVFWSSRLSERLGGRQAYGMAFLFLPAVLISVDRLVTDGALAALAVGFALYWARPSWRLALILTAAALARDTGFFLLGGYCAYLLLQRKWWMSARYALCAAPALAWYLYLWSRTAPYGAILSAPAFPLAVALRNLPAYPAGTPLIPVLQAADVLVVLGVVLGLGAMALLVVRGCLSPENLAGLIFVLLSAVYFPQHVYDLGRVYTPLLLFLGIQALRGRSILWLIPWLAVVPRVLMQMAPQLIGVWRAYSNAR